MGSANVAVGVGVGGWLVSVDVGGTFVSVDVGSWLVAVGVRDETVWLGREVSGGVSVCRARAKAVSKAAVLEFGGRLSLDRLHAESSAKASKTTKNFLAGTAVSLGNLYYKTQNISNLFQLRFFCGKAKLRWV